VDRNGLKGHVQTVRGLVAPEQLGPTMMHEHLLIDLRPIFDEPTDPDERALGHARMTLANLSWVTMNWCRNLDNLLLDDIDLAVQEALLFKRAGGGTIVDVTNVGLKRDPLALRGIAERTGLHIVMGCSYYHAFFHPPEIAAKTEEAIRDEIVRDILEGVDGTGVRAGIIGEIGCSSPMHPNEAKVLRGSALAQAKTGAPITIHPGRDVASPFEIMDILEAAGADPRRVVMGHMERTGLERGRLRDLARRGCYLEYDWFGEVRPTWPYGRVDVPSDGERIKTIAGIFEDGYGDQVLLSQDVCFKTRLASYGGPGYGHTIKYVAEWMRALGISAEHVDDMIVNNPRRVLQFV
jgi:phosphotriesterase-related protein